MFDADDIEEHDEVVTGMKKYGKEYIPGFFVRVGKSHPQAHQRYENKEVLVQRSEYHTADECCGKERSIGVR